MTVAGPLVAVDHNVRSSTLPTVDSDNLKGAVEATEHLIELGHRRIGFLAGRPDLESAQLRERGYRDALEAADIPFDPDPRPRRRLPGRHRDRRRPQPPAARRTADGDLRCERHVRDRDRDRRPDAGARRPRRSLRRRIRQRPRVGALRAAPDDGRPVDPEDGLEAVRHAARRRSRIRRASPSTSCSPRDSSCAARPVGSGNRRDDLRGRPLPRPRADRRGTRRRPAWPHDAGREARPARQPLGLRARRRRRPDDRRAPVCWPRVSAR